MIKKLCERLYDCPLIHILLGKENSLLRIPFSLFNATQILSIAYLHSCSPELSKIPSTTKKRGIQIHHQEHQKTGAEFSISSKKHQLLNHQRRCCQQIPKIGEKSERERNFNIASKTACRAFESFCPCHRLKARRCRKTGRLRAFVCMKKVVPRF